MKDTSKIAPLANYLRDVADELDRGVDPVLTMIDLLKLISDLLKIARIGEPK